jgi:hypothetical protein
MEKILLVINAHDPDLKQINFACRISKLAKTKLTGVFIENIYSEYQPLPGIDGLSYFNAVIEQDATSVIMETKQAVSIFKDQCQIHGVRYEAVVDHGEPINAVLFETKYADLLIADPRISFYWSDGNNPSDFARQLFHQAKCPIMIAAEKFDDVREIVFCFDASDSSVYAIKQFTYLFPGFSDRNILLLEVNASGELKYDDNRKRMMEWLEFHYKTVRYELLKGKAKDQLYIYCMGKQDVVIVMGAYGRSYVSGFFKKSSADPLIKKIDLPIFITHH